MTDRKNRPYRPPSLVLAVALLALQAGILAALAASIAVGPSEGGSSFPVVLFIALFAGLVALVATALWRFRRWARGAATAWSILMVLIGFSQLGANLFAAIVIIAVGLGTTAALLVPATRNSLH